MRRRRKKRGRVYGPYDERPDGWRVVVISAAGTRTSELCATEGEADRLKLAYELELAAETLTVTDALNEYRTHLGTRGNKGEPNKPRTITTTMDRVRSFFAGVEAAPGREAVASALEDYLVDIDTERCQELYDALAGRVAVDTHRNTLGQVRTFFRWAKKRGLVESNPLINGDGELAVEGVGRRRKRKVQLRIDEARLFRDAALELAVAGDRGALAALLTLLLGMCASEILQLAARDVDDEGRVLWIAADDADQVKTDNRRRTLAVPPELVDVLKAAAEGEGDLFATRERQWVRRQVHRICKLAGVPLVSAHGLRGTHSSLGHEFGASALAVAQSLGHSERVNRQNYTRPEAAAAAHQRRVADRLAN